MPLHEFHPFSRGELAQLPKASGIYVLFQVQIPIYVDSADNLQLAVRQARKKFPRATHFATEIIAHHSATMARRLAELRKQLRQVRGAAFVGPAADKKRE